MEKFHMAGSALGESGNQSERGGSFVGATKSLNLAQAIRARFAPLGGVDLEIPARELGRDPPRFDE